MTSGIYKLTFKDQLFYIGQSQDIETRWKQHRDKFTKGKAAEKMQEAYNRYGMPMGEILVECHKDYLDLMENYLINIAKRHVGCLNTSAPKPDPSVNYDFLLEHIGLIQTSAVDIIQRAIELTKEKDSLKNELIELLDNYNLDSMRIEAETELREGKDENAEFVVYYEEQLELYKINLNKANKRITKLLNRNWFDRLFNHQ